MFARNYGNILYTRRIVTRQRQLQTNYTPLHVALKQSRARRVSVGAENKSLLYTRT